MKPFLFTLYFLVIPRLAYADFTCLETKANQANPKQFLYLGENHWLLSVGQRLIELKSDKLVSSMDVPERLNLMCGQDSDVIATSRDTISKWQHGSLIKLPLPFKGNLAGSDGKVVYSTESTADGHVLYVNQKGRSKRIQVQPGLGGQMSGGTFRWGAYDKSVVLVLKNGRLAKKLRLPEAARFESVLDHENCKGQGLFDTNYDFYTQSRFGLQSRHIEGPIINIDYSKGCREYVFLLNDLSYAKGALWSLKPGEQLTFTPIPTSCAVDHFASNNDGSLYYRCGKQLYYKDKTRTKDVLLGEATKLQLTEGINDQWLATPKDGTLLAYLPRAKPSELRKACLVRLVPDKLTDLGCF